MKFLKACALLCVLVLIAAGPAYAVDLKALFGNKQQRLSLGDVYPIQNEEDFEDIAKSFHGKPFNDPQIEFEIMVPKDWSYEEAPNARSLQGPNELISNLAVFRSPVISSMHAVVTVQTVRLGREISAQNWLKNYIFSNKYNIPKFDAKSPSLEGNAIKAFRDKYNVPEGAEVKAFSERRAGAECIVGNLDGSSSYTYVTVQFNGNNAVIVRFDSPLPLERPLRYVRNRIVDSFRFILETDQPIEPLKSFTFSGALKFRYPESLVVNHVDIADPRSMSAQFYNQPKDGVVDKTRGKIIAPIQGLIRVVVVKRNQSTSFKKETKNMKDFVTNTLGLELRKLISSDKAPVSGRFLFSRYEIYQVIPKKNNPIPQEIRFVALGDKNWYIFGLLFSPSDNEDFYNWAVNTQDFDMMVKDFR